MGVSARSRIAEPLADVIARQVQSRTGGRIHSLSVELIGGDVVLSGRTDTYYVKQLATHAALDLAGQFSALVNDIVVT